MSKFIIDLRSSFWFIPAVVALAAAALALFAIELDARVGSDALARYPRLFGAGAEGTRQLLSAIASSTITVAGVVFSITIVALSLTAAQYSPRVLRGFMRDRANQLVLGMFLGVYVYCVLVLRTIRGGDHEFVPGIAVLGGIALALVGIAFLIFFIHHIATSIQVSEIAARVAADTIDAIEAQSGDDSHHGVNASPRPAREMTWTSVPARTTGYIQSVDHHRLVERACASGAVLRMRHGPGDFVVKGEALLDVSGAPTDELAASELNRAYAVNTYRDIAQDPAFGVQQLVDIALKALSPGVNDTATARTCLDYLTAILLDLVRRDPSEERHYTDAGGEVRLIARARSVDYFISSSFEAIRRNSTTNVDMLLHTAEALERVARATATGSCRAAVAREIGAVHEALAHTQHVSSDREKLLAAIAAASAALTAPPH